MIPGKFFHCLLQQIYLVVREVRPAHKLQVIAFHPSRCQAAIYGWLTFRPLTMKRILCLAAITLVLSVVCLWPELRGAVGLQSPSILVVVSDFTLDYTPESRTVTLSPHSGAAVKTATSDSNGQAGFVNVTPGLWELRIAGVGLPDYTLKVPNSSETLNATNLIISAWTPPAALPFVNTNLSELSKRLSIVDGSLLLDGVAVGGAGGDTVWTNSDSYTRPVENSDFWAFGNASFTSSTLSGSADIYAFGRTQFGSSTISESTDIYAYGEGSIDSANVISSSDVFGYGRVAIGSASITNSSDIYAFGTFALNTAAMTDSADVYAIGTGAGRDITGTFNNVVFLGKNATAADGSTDQVILGPEMQLILAGTTNQVIFGATNTAPAEAGTPAKWISVQVSGFTNAYRLPLYE